MSAPLDALKQSLRQLAPTALLAPASAVPSGLTLLDQKLEGGGLPILTELSGAPSSGKTSVALSIAAALSAGQLACFIDPKSELYPPAAAALGVDLGRLLWVRPGANTAAAARAAEIVIRSRAFSLVILDLPFGGVLARGVAQRLRTSASQTSTSILVLCDRAGSVEQAQARLDVSRGAQDFSILIHKGARGGAAQTAKLPTKRHRSSGAPPAPIAPIASRVAPGNEPPGARLPAPQQTASSQKGAI